MLIFDQLKRNDPQLRVIAFAFALGLGVLVTGLWWVQIVSSRDYQAHMETQAFRTVRIPAVRGKILDRNGTVLAENRPTYNVSLYLDELRKSFETNYLSRVSQRRSNLAQQLAIREKQRPRLTKEERKQFILSAKEKYALRRAARYEISSNVVTKISYNLQLSQPVTLNPTNFERHYDTRLALPLPVFTNLTLAQIARFEEQCTTPMGVDVEVQSTRVYPGQTTAAHVLGYLRRDDSSAEGEEAFFSYRLPDYRGVVGIEWGFDQFLRGKAGSKSVLVNNLGYRQTENVWNQAESGKNVVLTIDKFIQQEMERALPVFGSSTRSAAVVMDARSGDILAMGSSPTLNPNHFIDHFPIGEYQRMTNIQAEKNRATQENYQPGSIFKVVVAMAALEAGLDPNQRFDAPENPRQPGYAYIVVRGQKFRDTAPPGSYDFRRALLQSSNFYFITNGLRTGVENIVRLGQKLHLGERTGLETRQETAGNFPTLERVTRNWFDGDTANLCIGQGRIDVTPLQMAVMTAAIANGGRVLWPRLVDRIESQDPTSPDPPIRFQSGRVRNELGVRPRTLELVRQAMRADVEDPDGTGKGAAIQGFTVCGKTGTAQRKNIRNELEEHITWFISFAPFDEPRYAVVIMVETETGGSGAKICAPIAKKIYEAILKREQMGAVKRDTMAKSN